MRLTAIILLAACLQVSARAYSQKITLSVKNAPLEKIFQEIKKQSGYYFWYADELLQQAKRVDIEVKDATIEQVLEICLKGQPFSYEIVEKLIIIKRKMESSKKNSADLIPTVDTIIVKGKVLNEDNQPVPAATVSVRGGKRGAITNETGAFSIADITPDATLVISCVGYETQEIKVMGRSSIEAILKSKVGALDETVVIGYGTTTRRLSTGNISTVKAKDIEEQPVNNPLLTLQGRVPGLFVTQNTGIANGAVTVRIQGQNSIQSANEPLIVIDGVPYPSIFNQTGFGGPISAGSLTDGTPLSFINPAEIESIDVLKDADATAIYGSRGANGVILITTKRGKPGKTRVSINLQQGWGKVARKIDMLSTRQYLDMRYEAFKNDGVDWRDPSVSANDLKVWDTTRYTDWQKTLIGGTAQYTNINTTVSGGTEAMQYLVGATYNRTSTVFPGNYDDKRGAVNFNLNGTSANRKFQIQLSGSYMVDNNRLPEIDLTQNAIWLEPVAPPLYNADGSLNWQLNPSGSGTWENPLIYTKYKEYDNNTKNLISNAKLSYSVLPGLEILSSFGYNNLQTDVFRPAPLESISPQDRATTPRSAFFVSKNRSSWIIEPQVVYKKAVGKSKVEGLLGMTIQQNNSDQLILTGSGYASDLVLKNISAAPVVTVNSFTEAIYKYNALFGRFNYNFNDKYIINLTARRDGSSRFGDRDRFHNFGSIGAAWIFSQEGIVQKNIPFLSYGKLRSSYGTTGNDQIGDYTYLNLYYNTFAGIPYQGIIGLDPSSLSNPYIQWEETRKWQMGIDLGFLDDMIIINATYARNRSSNQILQYSLPTITGFPGVVGNFPATVQNTSWEFFVSSTNLKTKGFTWTSSVNLTIPRNKVVKFPNIEETVYASGFNGVIVGQPLGVQKVLHYIGVDPLTGLYVVADKNGKPVADFPNFPDDYNVLISTLPRFYGGFQNSISWKGFQLDLLFQFVRQLDTKSLYFLNDNRHPGSFASGSSNQPVTVLNRWQKPGDMASHARYNSDETVIPWPVASDVGYSYAASYIRLKNLSLSFQLPSRWLKEIRLQNAKVFLQGQNLATITNYTGLDPETKGASILPPLRIITIGLQVEL